MSLAFHNHGLKKYQSAALSGKEIEMQENQDNGWYERGELPPVGIECELSIGNFWKTCCIKGAAIDYGCHVVLVQVGEAAKIAESPKLFRPIKSEREKAIDEMVSVISGNDKALHIYADQYEYAAAKLYDSGYRKV